MRTINIASKKAYRGVNIIALWSAVDALGYAIEELVAELGAAFLCADLQITVEPC